MIKGVKHALKLSLAAPNNNSNTAKLQCEISTYFHHAKLPWQLLLFSYSLGHHGMQQVKCFTANGVPITASLDLVEGQLP